MNSIKKNTISLQWKVDDIGGALLRGFTLKFKRQSAEWVELLLDRRLNTYVMENLQCGTKYQFTIITFNIIGTSLPSDIKEIMTKGNNSKEIKLKSNE